MHLGGYMSLSKAKLAFREIESDEITDIGWLLALRLHASGIAPCDNNLRRNGVPQHLSPLITDGNENITQQHLLTLIKAELLNYESEVSPQNNVIFKNLKRLAKKFEFNAIEIDILFIRILCRLHLGLEQTIDSIPENRWFDEKLHKFLSIALKKPEIAIKKALADNGKLCKSGLVGVRKSIGGSFTDKIFVMDGFVCAMCSPTKNIDELLSFALKKAPTTSLTMDDYIHQLEPIQLIQQHITAASQKGIKGVNILLYGNPGVGKTELARAISTSLQMNAYNVSNDNSEEGFQTIHPRFRCYQLLQAMLSQTPASLVIFDEIEDVLPRPGILDKPTTNNKAWLNELLENNAVPSIWIANHVWQIDPAFMRRFDFVLEVKTPPRKARGTILKKAFQTISVDDAWLDKKAGEPDLTPALIKKSISVLQHSSDQTSSHLQLQFDLQMKERRNAQGLSISGSYPELYDYQLEYLNTGMDNHSLVTNIAKNQKGKILLFGPPGCGKTAFAHYLAKVSDKPLMVKRASDLISMWLGETETNLRNMFDEASRDDAILLLDEADSFLQDRRHAERSWELTQVNELLTQMENFNGVFVCATNFMEHIDKAAMRRFSFKLKFGYLNPEQSERLFNNTLKKLGSAQLTILIQQLVKQQLTSLKNLTPGDFKVVSDSFEILNKTPSYKELLQLLAKECDIKNHGQLSSIGFVA